MSVRALNCKASDMNHTLADKKDDRLQPRYFSPSYLSCVDLLRSDLV